MRTPVGILLRMADHDFMFPNRELFDYSAKLHEEDHLPICPAGEGKAKGADVEPGNELMVATDSQVVDDYSCGPGRPCSNGACCSKKTGYCNYGPKACGTNNISPNDVCWSNCDAKAECGRYADPPGKKCPLNVCCSQYGFCGFTKDFCKKTKDKETSCQSNCDQPRPGKKAGGQDIVVGYYEAWRHDSTCQGMGLKDIPVNSLTHLFFSFGYITPGDFKIAGMDGLPYKLFSEFTSLKKKNPGLKTVVALGGWTFNDPGPTQKVYSDMVSTKANRAKFIENLFAFMREYAFDGVDFDWEYPGAADRGGIPSDGKNFVQFLKELDKENKKQPFHYTVSFTAPSSYWYLRHFDLKAVDYVDFVNMMTYDLHGVWDSNNPIGNHIYGHSNITEMRQALDLLWRNDVPANKVNMGLGFYGRSFQLQDPSCDKPGCPFKGGAAPGACSKASGILTYREIMEMVKKENHKRSLEGRGSIKPFHDKESGVKYITYDQDQWVSFDDADTFKQKKEFAKELGLGGYLIWAIDQDDDQRSGLQSVIAPKALGDFKNAAKDKSFYEDAHIPSCYTTGCDGNCKAGFIKITEQDCGDGKKSKLCCPLEGAPDPADCTWRGTAPFCNGHCHDNEVTLLLDKHGDGNVCWDGNKVYCCKSPLAEGNKCSWGSTGSTTCSNGYKPLTFSGLMQSFDIEVEDKIKEVTGKKQSIDQVKGDELTKVLDGLDIAASTTIAMCFLACKSRLTVREVAVHVASGEHLFLPVPLENLFEHPPTGDNVNTDFDLNLDDEDGDPDNTAFQFVVMTSPEEIQTSLDKRDGSHWDVFGCKDAVTEGEHTVQMVCTDFSENSNCHKISLGEGVPGTILQMPKGCGPGKYAVAKSMERAKSQLIPRHLASRVPSKGVVYDLTFDYDFSRVPRGMGDTQMRVDFSNQDNYWDQVVAASPSKKKRKRSLDDVDGNHLKWLEDEFRDDYHFGGLEKRDLHERWFGSSVIEWLTKMVTPEIKRDYTHNFEDTLTAVIVDETWRCEKNDIKYDGHVKAKALTNMKISTTFGFTLIVTSLRPPLDLSKSYLTFYNKGEITATLTVDAVAHFTYNKEKTILSLPFPGATFRIPGIVTIGPQVHISGSIDAQLTAAAKFETKIDIAKWEIRQTLPNDGSDEYKPKEIGEGDPSLDKTGDFNGIQKPQFYAGVKVSGDITAKLRAAAEFGIRFDDSWDVGAATAGVVGEGSVMVKMAAGISTTAECPFTYGMQVGAHLYARADASIFKWPKVEKKIVGWDKDVLEGGTCPDLGMGSVGEKSIPLGLPWVMGNNITSKPDPSVHERSLSVSDHSLQKRAGVYGPAFKIPIGELFCPTDKDLHKPPKNSTDCSTIPTIWGDDGGDEYESVTGFARRHGELEKRGNKMSHLCHEKDNAELSPAVPGLYMSKSYPSSGDLSNADAYGFTSIICTDFTFGAPLNTRLPSTSYDTEHVLEFQLPNLLMVHLHKTKGETYDHPDPNMKDANGN
ncbi:hypothetical protein FQN49_005565, partial [Arthroderma sp. PD_2]